MLLVALYSRNDLRTSLVQKCAKIVDVYDISMDLGASIIEIFVNGCFIHEAPINSGSNINLMSVETMEEIGLKSTPIILKMAN